MKNYCDITILVDRSGSMDIVKDSMEKAYVNFLEEHKVNPDTRVSLILFDNQDINEIAYLGVPVAFADPLRLRPRGWTPLLDALSQAIDRTGARYANMSEEDRPIKVLFVTITDGKENWSKNTTRQQLFDKVRKQSEDYNWQFVYLGANQDAIEEAKNLGFDWKKAITYSHNNEYAGLVLDSVTSNTVAYAKAGGTSANLNYSKDQRFRGLSKEDKELLKGTENV